ncbi:MAG: ribosome small subunit-dependent GTPase A [Clostridia bacterium]|nr:ribosome small subunit-dependent GTPase A [Clostridia bacterium]
MNGLILKAVSSFYYVDCEDKVYECKARGNFRKTGISPVVGDKVDFTLTDGEHGVVESIKERKNILNRPIIANIDKLFIVSSYSVPKPDTVMIDRLTAVCIFNNIEPIIVFNKCDMGDFENYKKIYNNSGFKTYIVSALTNEGIKDIKSEVQNCISAFVGNSGVGKSSILNAVFGELSLKTGEVSDKLGRGRHTTRHTQLFKTEYGGYVADTPGFSSIETADKNYEFKLHLAESFPDISKFTDSCKFTTCTHTCEKGCRVLKAVEDGKLEKSRHNSYKQMFCELKDIKKWNSDK